MFHHILRIIVFPILWIGWHSVIFAEQGRPEQGVVFYHTNHIGSSSVLTDKMVSKLSGLFE
jgi:hypothetical protein